MDLRNRIMDLQQALFFNDSYSVLKFPISIINVSHVDDVGQVWFLVNRPGQNLNEFEKEFRARLAFYKKGKDFYLNVSGKACIVTDPEDVAHAEGIDDETKKLALTSMVLIRMSVTGVQYYSTQKPLQWPTMPKFNMHPSAFVKSLQDVVKNIIPVFQSH
jgi:hypothetical protein